MAIQVYFYWKREMVVKLLFQWLNCGKGSFAITKWLLQVLTSNENCWETFTRNPVLLLRSSAERPSHNLLGRITQQHEKCLQPTLLFKYLNSDGWRMGWKKMLPDAVCNLLLKTLFLYIEEFWYSPLFSFEIVHSIQDHYDMLMWQFS